MWCKDGKSHEKESKTITKQFRYGWYQMYTWTVIASPLLLTCNSLHIKQCIVFSKHYHVFMIGFQIKAILFVVFYHRLININMIRLQDSTFHSMFNIRDNIIQNKKWMLVFHAIRRMEGKSFHDVFSLHNAAYRPNKIFSVALEVFSLLSSCRQRIS